MNGYAEFLIRKTQLGDGHGFEPVWMPDFLFDFQASLVEWAVRRGRAAIFAGCGMGKTPCQLAWAENVVRKTNRPVLVLAPIAVGAQTVREAEKFGVEAVRSSDGKFPAGGRKNIHEITDVLIGVGYIPDDPDDYRRWQEELARKAVQAHRRSKQERGEIQRELVHLFEVKDDGSKINYYKPCGKLNAQEAAQHVMYWRGKTAEAQAQEDRYHAYYRSRFGDELQQWLRGHEPDVCDSEDNPENN